MGSNQSKVSAPLISPSSTNSTTTNNNSSSSSQDELATATTRTRDIPNDSIHKNIVSSSGGGGCPMKKKDGSGYVGSWFGGSHKHGKTKDVKSEPQNDEGTTNNNNNNNNSAREETSRGVETGGGEGGGCPVKHNNRNSKSNSNDKNNQVQYNVYSQPIDPKNNMPTVANQLPSPMQTETLSTTRIKSTIPKGGGGENNNNSSSSSSSSSNTWTYPSPQMFYNSLARKGKLGDTKEEDIESVVALHNNMNEKTWNKVIQWEETVLGKSEGQESKLLKFMGRPSDLSPKARIKNILFGHPLPFDRHDWTIVRKDGTEVRYVIDYYYDETKASDREDSGLPAMDDYNAVKSILVDVRPALDNPEAAFSRAVTMPMARHIHENTAFQPLPIQPTTDLKSQVLESQKVWADIQRNVEESKSKSMILKQDDIPQDQRKEEKKTKDLPNMSDEEAKEIALSFASMIGQCRSVQKVVEACKDEAECAKASLALTMCLAKVVCPLQQSVVQNVLNDDDSVDVNDKKAVEIYNAKFDKALENMALCVTSKSERAAIARQTHPDLFKGQVQK